MVARNTVSPIISLRFRGIGKTSTGQPVAILREEDSVNGKKKNYYLSLTEEEATILLLETELPCCIPSVWNLVPLFLILGKLEVTKISFNVLYPDGSLGATLHLKGRNKIFWVEIGKTEGLFLAKNFLKGEIEGHREYLKKNSFHGKGGITTFILFDFSGRKSKGAY